MYILNSAAKRIYHLNFLLLKNFLEDEDPTKNVSTVKLPSLTRHMSCDDTCPFQFWTERVDARHRHDISRCVSCCKIWPHRKSWPSCRYSNVTSCKCLLHLHQDYQEPVVCEIDVGGWKAPATTQIRVDELLLETKHAPGPPRYVSGKLHHRRWRRKHSHISHDKRLNVGKDYEIVLLETITRVMLQLELTRYWGIWIVNRRMKVMFY